MQGDTDSQATRLRRGKLLESVLSTVFERKDERRIFTPEQRRLLWNSDAERRCDGCRTRLSWENFAADHVRPHSRGGRTTLRNAALLCKSCNSRKGNKVVATKRRRRALA